MKNVFLKIILPVVAFAGSLCAECPKGDAVTAPQYNHRMVVFHPAHQGYEYLPNDDLYLGIDLLGSTAYHTEDRNGKLLLSAEVRMGRSYFLNGTDHVRPIVGGGVFRDMTVVEHYVFEERGLLKTAETKQPMIAYGFVGCMVDHEFSDRLSLGLTAKAIVGGIAGKKYGNPTTFRYGTDVSLPLTIRLGCQRRWDLRLEPYALVMNDGNRYIGHRSAIAYRF